MNLKNRTLFIADNLDILRGINTDCIDLIYLDPPFNTKKQYKAPIGSPAEGAEFKDIWTDDDIKSEWHGEIAEQHEELYQVIQAAETLYDKSMKIYLMAMAVRLFEMHRILKPTGSIYLHCDPTASHYLKMVMDSLFGKENFRNEIVWCYNVGGKGAKQWGRKHDVILFYSRSNKFHFDGKAVGIQRDTGAKSFGGKIGKDENGRPYQLDEPKIPEDWWVGINSLHSGANERTGYPTQKPLALLYRIIKASSNEGDIVLDPFCGCATACVAAEQLGRQWIGIDISPSAEVLAKIRLDEASQQGTLLSPLQMSEVLVQTQPPVRTDNDADTASQLRLPRYPTHKPELFGRQEGKCNGCQCPFHFRNLTVDHIKPQSKDGTDHIENLQLLCAACNSTKGTGTQDALLARLKEQGIRTDPTRKETTP